MNLDISAALNLGSQGNDVARLQVALASLGRTVAVAESSGAILEPSTLAVIKAFQQENRAPVTGIVDAATVRVINATRAALPASQHVVRGTVRDADGHPFVDGVVDLFRHTPNAEQTIGSATLDKTDDTYEIAYSPVTLNPAVRRSRRETWTCVSQ